MDVQSLIENSFDDTKELKVLTNLLISRNFSQESYVHALEINSVLKKIKTDFQKTNLPWKRNMIQQLNLKVSESSLKDWFLGRASISFFELKKIAMLGGKREYANILKNCSYFCTKTSSPVRFPKYILGDLAWVVAAILCDGHMRKNREGIAFEVGDELLAQKFSTKFASLFEVQEKKPRPIDRIGRNRTYSIEFCNIAAMLFLGVIFEVPFGRKSSLIQVPNIILGSNKKIKQAFLKGVFETDGGKRGGGLGLTSLSESFVDEVNVLLREFGVTPNKEAWLNKRYDKKCFGSRFKIDAYSMFLLRQKLSFCKNP
jgi:hypothetical protein